MQICITKATSKVFSFPFLWCAANYAVTIIFFFIHLTIWLRPGSLDNLACGFRTTWCLWFSGITLSALESSAFTRSFLNFFNNNVVYSLLVKRYKIKAFIRVTPILWFNGYICCNMMTFDPFDHNHSLRSCIHGSYQVW